MGLGQSGVWLRLSLCHRVLQGCVSLHRDKPGSLLVNLQHPEGMYAPKVHVCFQIRWWRHGLTSYQHSQHGIETKGVVLGLGGGGGKRPTLKSPLIHKANWSTHNFIYLFIWI